MTLPYTSVISNEKIEWRGYKIILTSTLPIIVIFTHGNMATLQPELCFGFTVQYYNYIHMLHPWWRSYMLRYPEYITTLLLLLLYDATTYHILNTYMPPFNNLTILYTVYTTIVGLQVHWITRTCFQGPLKNEATFATPTPIITHR